jgi:hypothetical protein
MCTIVSYIDRQRRDIWFFYLYWGSYHRIVNVQVWNHKRTRSNSNILYIKRKGTVAINLQIPVVYMFPRLQNTDQILNYFVCSLMVFSWISWAIRDFRRLFCDKNITEWHLRVTITQIVVMSDCKTAILSCILEFYQNILSKWKSQFVKISHKINTEKNDHR